MLYESFKSDIISKVNAFLVKKFGKNDFLEVIRTLKDNFDLPISEIIDSDIKYLKKENALKIKPPTDWESNKYDIYAIKIWFSLDNGLLGYTGIGNKIITSNDSFKDDEIEYIKDNLDIKKGRLIPFSKSDGYKDLKTGDDVISYISMTSKRNIISSKFFIENEEAYAIQNRHEGGSPVNNFWKDFGKYSWSLGKINRPSSDHSKLHKYIKSDEDLHVYEDEIFVKNLPISRTDLIEWSTSWEAKYKKSIIEDSDYSVVIYLDDILKRGYKKVSDTKKERKEIKSGAFLTDEEVKEMNIERYLDSLFNKLNIEDIDNIKNLEKYIKIVLCWQYPVYSLFYLEPNYKLKSFIGILSELIKYKDRFDKDDIITQINTLKKYFISNYKHNTKILKIFKKSEDYIFNLEDNSTSRLAGYSYSGIKESFKVIKEINDMIYDYIKKLKIETISDMSSIVHKINYIHSIFNDPNIGKLDISTLLNNYMDVGYYIETKIDDLVKYEKYDNTKDIKKLNNIKKYIKSILN
jgi:hypothetical protein